MYCAHTNMVSEKIDLVKLIGLIDDLSKGLDSNTQIDAILLDFYKAFDKVHHTSSLKKLKFLSSLVPYISGSKTF